MFSAISSWEAADGQVLLVTLTIRHKAGDRLEPLWDLLASSWSLTAKGQPWSRQMGLLKSPGYVKTVEINHGRSGWHPHLHVIVFASATCAPEDVDAFRQWLEARWISKVKSLGGNARRSAQSVEMRRSRASSASPQFSRGTSPAALAGYVTKPATAPTTREPSPPREESGVARTDSHWDLLHRASQGDTRAQRLWREFEQASHGRRQQTWSHGLRQRLTALAPKPSQASSEPSGDESIQAPTTPDDRVYISATSWDRLLRPRPALILALLDAAEAGPIPLRHFLRTNGIHYREDLPRRGDPPTGDLPPAPAHHPALLGRWSA